MTHEYLFSNGKISFFITKKQYDGILERAKKQGLNTKEDKVIINDKLSYLNTFIGDDFDSLVVKWDKGE